LPSHNRTDSGHNVNACAGLFGDLVA